MAGVRVVLGASKIIGPGTRTLTSGVHKGVRFVGRVGRMCACIRIPLGVGRGGTDKRLCICAGGGDVSGPSGRLSTFLRLSLRRLNKASISVGVLREGIAAGFCLSDSRSCTLMGRFLPILRGELRSGNCGYRLGMGDNSGRVGFITKFLGGSLPPANRIRECSFSVET